MPNVPSTTSATVKSDEESKLSRTIEIREVWASNLQQEINLMQELVEQYPYVAMVCRLFLLDDYFLCNVLLQRLCLSELIQDTEFPGVVVRPVGAFKTSDEYHYQTLKCNVDVLKIIQLGLSFSDENGVLPDLCCTWQFNFKFSLRFDFSFFYSSINAGL